MKTILRKKFYPVRWLEAEVTALIDSYGGTKEEQLRWVRDQLIADEYRDELTDSQRDAVLRLL